MPDSARRSEPAFNQAFGALLAGRNRLWRDLLKAESTAVQENAAKRPDILLDQGRDNPVAIETEYEPARSVEQDARARLGEKVLKTGVAIEQAIAVRIPDALRGVGAGGLDEAIGKAAFRFAVFTATEEGVERFPETGWTEGDIDDIARVMDLCSLSERLIAKTLSTMELKVSQAANLLGADLPDFPDAVRKIAATLNQTDGEQTRRMAMAIVANAMVLGRLENRALT